jgi:hypothetical protein
MNKKIVNWIADSDNLIQSLWQDWNFLVVEKQVIPIISGTDEYSLATLGITDLVRWDHANFYINPGTASYAQLIHFKYKEWLESSARLGLKILADPTQFVIKRDNSIVFVDKPNADKTVWASYFKSITKMSLNADQSNIPAPLEDVIIYRAQMLYAQYYEDDDLYKEAKINYDEALMKLEAAELPENFIRTTAANNREDATTVVE